MMEFEVSGINEAPRKAKFEKDFIMLSEFSELVGPLPVCIIPDERAKGGFDVSHFSVRIMSSDFQGLSGKLVGEDTQVVLSESQDCAHAYIHYFSLNDNCARGFVRQFCLSYITSSPSKIIDNFGDLLKEFSQVIAILKVSNHKLFQKDISRHQADLDLTWKLLQEEGYTEACNIDSNQLYTGFDFTKEDVPERDPAQVTKDMEETRELLTSIKRKLEKSDSKRVLEDLKRMRDQYRDRKHRERERSSTFPQDNGSPNKGESGFTSYVPTPVSFQCGARVSSESLASESISSSDSIEYQPQRVMTHIVHKFERRLRPLEELSPQACPIAMDKLLEIHKHFCRSESTLEMEKEEISLLDPRSSLLTIGRVPVLNMLQEYSPFSQDQPSHSYQTNHQQRRISSVVNSLHLPVPYRISSRNTWGVPNQHMENSVMSVDQQTDSGFDPSFLDDKLGLKCYPLYMDSTHYYYRRRTSDSFATIEDPLHILSSSVCRLDTDSESNLLVIPPADNDDDGTSRESATFATPEGLTPRSSEEEEEEGEGYSNQHKSRTESGAVGGGGGVVFESQSGNDSLDNPISLKFDEASVVHNTSTGQPQFLLVPTPPGLAIRLSGSLERSGNSSPHFHLESGSQSTLTDSKEDKCDSIRDHRGGGGGGGAQVQVNKTDQIGIDSSQGSESPIFSTGKGHHSGHDTCDGAMLSTRKANPSELSFREDGYSINNSNEGRWEGSEDLVTFQPREGGVVDHQDDMNGYGKNFSKTGSSNLVRRSKIDEFEENYLAGSGQYIEQGAGLTAGQGGTLRQDNKSGSPLMPTKLHHSPVGSIGVASNTSDEQQPLSLVSNGKLEGHHNWVKKKKNEVLHPPSDLQLRREQSLPDVYHTPLDSASFYAATTKSAYRWSPTSHDERGCYQPAPYSLPISPSQRSYASITSMDAMMSERSLLRGPSVLEVTGKAILPLVSTVDYIEGSFKFKPGKGIIHFCRNTPNVTDLIYCLLQGRPLVLMGKSGDQNLIRRIIRTLWLFVPGHSSQRQIVAWQETPLDVRDLSRVKLVGLNSELSGPLGPHIKRYISYWDCSTGKLYTPSYSGELLKPIVFRTKDKKNEEVFLTHIHSVLLEIAMKAFVYYHGYCTLMPNNKKSSPYALSPKKHHMVLDKTNTRKHKTSFLHKLGVKNSDEDIIEYFVDVIREQQLVEWGLEPVNGNPLDDEPVRIHLQTKHCTESFCKPKRPY